MFLIKKRRSADAQYWTVTISDWQKQLLLKKAVLKNCAIFAGKHLFWNLLFIKLQT